MKLLLIEGFSKPERAQLDPLFNFKEEIHHYCLWWIARLKAKDDLDLIPLLQFAPHSQMLANHVRHQWRHLQTAVKFDEIFTNTLWEAGEEPREEYKKLQISDPIIEQLNRLDTIPKYLTPPLILNDGKIASLYTGKFYGRIDVDLFGHRGLIIRNSDRGRYFASYEAGRKFHLFTQPFLVRQDLEADFRYYGVTFSEAFDVMKGLFSGWYRVFL